MNVLAMQSDDDGDDVQSGNHKGTDWVATVVSGVIVGLILALAMRLSDRGDDTRDLVIGLKQQMAAVSDDVKDIKTRPGVSREDFQREIARLEQRINDVERRQR